MDTCSKMTDRCFSGFPFFMDGDDQRAEAYAEGWYGMDEKCALLPTNECYQPVDENELPF